MKHPIAPLYDSRSKVLILGTMPSPKSREAGFYYAHPQNRFWPVLARVLGVPCPKTTQARRALALARGIALWDVLRECDITGASDSSIRNPIPNDLSPILAAAHIRAIFTTGKKSTDLYNRYLFSQTKIACIPLPSTSPANCAVSMDGLAECYQQILTFLEEPQMERIKSFQVDHNKLKNGLYVSRVDGDTVTYDLRMCTPNGGAYLENAALHTVEHLFATYVRVVDQTFSDRIIYVGPMGCRTGFYFITRDTMSKEETIALLQKTFAYIAAYEGEIPGAAERECGNYRDHDLAGARKIAADYGAVIAGWTPAQMEYEQ